MDAKTTESTGLRLLKKGQQGLIRCIFGRMGLVLILLLVKVLYLLAVFLWFEEYIPQVFSGHALIAVGMVLYLVNSRIDPMAKITWLVIVMPLPVFGTLLFIFTQSELGQKVMKLRLKQIGDATKDLLPQNQTTAAAFKKTNPGGSAMARYAAGCGVHPVFQGTDVTYFPLGEDKFARMLEELEKAEKYIYLEYFIISEGEMWGRILEILARKAAQGVDVRLMYDGTCEFALLPKNYPKRLRELGIRCKVFSPMTPLISTHYNYRDHRKILVIDGHTAFNGGINLSDEYINKVRLHGHWKDTAVMLRGPAAMSFGLMFLQLWNLSEKHPQFTCIKNEAVQPIPGAKGYVMPYGDDPLDKTQLGKRVYIDLLNRARQYVHIMTPYLILDSETENALIYAARRGVDVKLLLPGIPDKKIPYALAKTHYPTLLDGGVKIYEYTPGFVHSKVFVCDDAEAVVGTINLDYRSLYHHFECATYLCGVDCISDIEADFQSSIDKSRNITHETYKKEKWSTKMMGFLMKLAAPLM